MDLLTEVAANEAAAMAEAEAEAVMIPDFEISEAGQFVTHWSNGKLYQMKTTCAAGRKCLMGGVHLQCNRFSNRCSACGFALHLSCHVKLKNSTETICRSCGNTTAIGRRVEVEPTDELEELMSKKKIDMELVFLTKQEMNAMIARMVDGLDDPQSTDGKFFMY
jgi:hypothetical protein